MRTILKRLDRSGNQSGRFCSSKGSYKEAHKGNSSIIIDRSNATNSF